MKVNYNNLRRKTANDFNRIIKSMKSINYNGATISEILDDSQTSIIEDLRDCIVGLVCVYEEGNEDFKEIDVELLSLVDD